MVVYQQVTTLIQRKAFLKAKLLCHACNMKSREMQKIVRARAPGGAGRAVAHRVLP
jgi:hypothetical protein